MDPGGVDNSELTELTRGIERIATGDLTHRVDTGIGYDELASGINEMVRDIEGAIIEIRTFGVQVSTTTDRISTRTEQLQQETENATAAVEASEAATTRQSRQLRETRAKLLTLSRTLGNVSSAAEGVASLSATVADDAADSADLDEAAVSNLRELRAQTAGITRTLDGIESTVDEIVSMLDEATTSHRETVDHVESASTEITNQADTLGEIDRWTDELADTVTNLGQTLGTFTAGSAGDREQLALTNPTYEAAVQYIERHNDTLLARSEDVVVAYTEQADRDFTDEVNIAGRQRMLSQRIAKKTLFIARNERAGSNSVAVRDAKTDLQSYVEEFDNALETLAAGGTHRGIELQHAPREVLDEIDRTRAVWEPFKKNALTVVDQSRFKQEFVESLDLSDR